MIAPVYEKMQEEFPSVVFTKIDVDANEEAAAACGIQAMPTFQFYKGGQKVGKLRAPMRANSEQVPYCRKMFLDRLLLLIVLQELIAEHSKA